MTGWGRNRRRATLPGMTQIAIDLDEDAVRRLRERAELHGRSVEEEAGTILRAAVTPNEDPRGFGTRMAELFEGIGFREGEFQRPELVMRPPIEFDD